MEELCLPDMSVDGIWMSSIHIGYVWHNSNYYMGMYDMRQDGMCSASRRLTGSRPRLSHLFWPSTRHVPVVGVYKLSLYHIAMDTLSLMQRPSMHISRLLDWLFTLTQHIPLTHPCLSVYNDKGLLFGFM